MANSVLYLGFSVMAQIDPALTKAGESRGLTVHVASFGGHLLKSMTHLIDVVLDWRDSDAVVLDLTTPDVRPQRKNMHVPEWMGEMDNVVRSIRARGRRVGMVHLYRSDVDFENDELIAHCDRYCRNYGIMSRNLGQEVARGGLALTDGFLKDIVHPAPAGMAFYTDHLLEFGEMLLQVPKIAPLYYRSPNIALGFAELLGRRGGSEITRHGPPIRLVDLGQGEAVTVTIPDGRVARAVLIAYGPKSGPIRITTEDQQPEIIPGHDEFSYYERLAPVMLRRPISGRVTFEQLSDLPVIPLKKGEPDMGARVGKLGYILAS